MGSFDGADMWYVNSRISKVIDKRDTGLYRDDGLLILRNGIIFE